MNWIDEKSVTNSFEENASTRPLLDDDLPRTFKQQRRMPKWFTVASITFFILNLVLLSFNLSLFFDPPTSDHLVSYSPASTAVHYSLQSTSHSSNSPLGGPPTPENIKAWEDLIQPTFFSASGTDLQRAGADVNTSVKLAEGGYVASLGIYHEIHCLRQIRLYLYHETFYPNLTAANIEYVHHHLDHCLEAIRKSLMCAADLSIYAFEWIPEDQDRPHPKTNSVRKCADWESVEKWASSRKVALDPVLIRPMGEAKKVHM